MLQNLLVKLRPYGWNVRQFSIEDFYYFCNLAEVEIIEERTGHIGLYDMIAGVPVIILSPSIAGYFKLWVAFHELAHCWLHAPGAGFLHGSNVVEEQADIIASCAVLPRPLLEQDQLSYVIEEDYPASLIKLRFDVLNKYGL